RSGAMVTKTSRLNSLLPCACLSSKPLPGLLIVEARLRSPSAHFNLCADLLDLQCLLFQVCSESFNLFPLLRGSRPEILLLLRDGRLLFCNKGLELGHGRFHCLHFVLEAARRS